MSVINIEQISKLYGDKMVLDGLTASVDEMDKIGIIGVNGTGKSTLLRMLAGDEEPDDGKIIYSNNMTKGWLPQSPVFHEDATVLSYVLSDLKEMDYVLESEAKSMLLTLEIEDFDQKIAELSGGQRKRVALCKVLLQKPDILILDEPTNHLDNRMSDWLEQYLTRLRSVVIFVTHDRYFLDQVSNHIWEIDKGRVYNYDTNYSGYLELKAEREDIALAAERKRQSILRNEIKWVMRGARARSTKQKARLERYETLKALEAPQGTKSVEIEAIGARLGKKTIEIEHLSKGYGDKELITDFSYIFKRFERIGFVGVNGCGKSTLMKIIAGLEDPDSGSISWGDTIKIGYFAQECEEMDERLRVIDYIKDEAEYIRTTTGLITASRMLERFLFSSDMQYTPIAKISGGERRRLYLLKTIMSSPNVLILDEPTNDLDIATLQVLEGFLDTFMGIVICVSHDRYFLDRIADRICAFEDGYLRIYEGGYMDYLEKSRNLGMDQGGIESISDASKIHNKKDNSSKGGKNDSALSGAAAFAQQKRAAREKKLRFTFKEQKEFETIDDDIAALENKISELDELMVKNSSDFVKLNEYMEQKAKAEEELEYKMERWVYLNDLNEKIEAQKNL